MTRNLPHNDKLFLDVGRRLKELRGNKSQKQMAQELGVPFRSYCRYEAGERPPPLALSTKIARRYKTTIDWIMGGLPVEEGDHFRESDHRYHLLSEIVGLLELSIEREQKWLERQNFRHPGEEWESLENWKEFTKQLRQWCKQYDEGELLTGQGGESSELSSPIELMKQWLNEFWVAASDDERTWMKVQFGKCFPQFVEWFGVHAERRSEV